MLFCIIGMLFISTNLYAASGDFIVNGNLGVGTTDPTFGGKTVSKLSIVGTTGLAIGSSATLPALAINPNANASWNMYDFVNGGWNLGIIQSSAKVGIGTPSPAAKLPVVSESDGYFTYSDVGFQIFNAEATTGNPVRLGSAYSRPALYRNGPLDINTEGNPLYINSNVGIGNAAPAYKLDVAGDIRAAGTIRGNVTGNVTGNATTATNADTIDNKHITVVASGSYTGSDVSVPLLHYIVSVYGAGRSTEQSYNPIANNNTWFIVQSKSGVNDYLRITAGGDTVYYSVYAID